MHAEHVMIDLETLSTENDAAIIGIGVVEFNLERILKERRWLIDPRLASGRREDSTLTWWKEQKGSTVADVWSGRDRETLVFLELAQFLDPLFETHWIWAGPSTFDLSILKTRYRSAGITYPINWRNERDLTTLSRVAQELKIDYSGEAFDDFVAHDPLSDSIKQARRTQIILKALAHQFDTRASEERVFQSTDR